MLIFNKNRSPCTVEISFFLHPEFCVQYIFFLFFHVLAHSNA